MSRQRRRHITLGRAGGGFTLLELLLAFVVFALSFATVLEILSGSMRNTVRARHYSEAALIAQSVVDQLGLEIPLQMGSSANGESGDYDWVLDISEFVSSDPNDRSFQLAELTGIVLLQIDLEVSWGQAPREQVRRFGTVRAVLANQEQGR